MHYIKVDPTHTKKNTDHHLKFVIITFLFTRIADCQKTAARIKFLKEEIRNLKLKLAKVWKILFAPQCLTDCHLSVKNTLFYISPKKAIFIHLLLHTRTFASELLGN